MERSRRCQGKAKKEQGTSNHCADAACDESERGTRRDFLATRDVTLRSRPRGGRVAFAYKANLRKSFRPIARLMNNPPSSAISGRGLAVCGSSSVALTGATATGAGVAAATTGGVVWMTVVTSTSFWSGVTAVIGAVFRVLSSTASTVTAGTITFVICAN